MKLKHVFTTFIPERKEMEENTLYISEEYETAIHICPCGCGTEAVTPTRKDGWEITVKDGVATLHPSILNRGCQAHYWIQDGEIKYC